MTAVELFSCPCCFLNTISPSPRSCSVQPATGVRPGRGTARRSELREENLDEYLQKVRREPEMIKQMASAKWTAVKMRRSGRGFVVRCGVGATHYATHRAREHEMFGCGLV